MITAISPQVGAGRTFVWRENFLVRTHEPGDPSIIGLDLRELCDLKIVSADAPERSAGGGGFFGVDMGGLIVGSGGSETLPAKPAVVSLEFRDGTALAMEADRDDLGELFAIVQRNAKNDSAVQSAICSRAATAAESAAAQAADSAASMRSSGILFLILGLLLVGAPRVLNALAPTGGTTNGLFGSISLVPMLPFLGIIAILYGAGSFLFAPEPLTTRRNGPG